MDEIGARNIKELFRELDRLYWLNWIQAIFSSAIFFSIWIRDVL